MRLALLMSLSMLSFSPLASFGADCTCTKECSEQCKKGQGQNCKCEQCDCKKTGKCSDGHCKHELKK